MKFKVGDYVLGTIPYLGINQVRGVVVGIDYDDDAIGVRFETDHGKLHSLNGLCEKGCGWWFYDDYYDDEYIELDKHSIFKEIVSELYDNT